MERHLWTKNPHLIFEILFGNWDTCCWERQLEITRSWEVQPEKAEVRNSVELSNFNDSFQAVEKNEKVDSLNLERLSWKVHISSF